MQSSEGQARPILWVLFLALLLRLSLFLVVAPNPDGFFSPDGRDFVEISTKLGDVYAGHEGRPFTLGLVHPPGYPIVIATVFSVIDDAPWLVVLLQIAVGVVTVWLTYRLASQLLGPVPALWAALALAVDPISIVLTNYIQPETIFTFLVVAGTLLWSRGLQSRSMWLGAGAGALFGAAVLFRPIGQYLPAVVIPATQLLHGGRWRKRLAFAIALLLVFAIPVGGWIVRNTAVSGVPVLSAGEGTNLLYFRAASALGDAEGLSFTDAQKQLRGLVQHEVEPGMNRAERSRIQRSLAIKVLFDHPVAALKSIVKGVGLMMIGPGRAELLHLLGDPTPTQISGPVQLLLIAAEIVLYSIILIGAVFGSYYLLRNRKYSAAVVLFSVILYFIAAAAVTTPYSRYRVPIMPFIAILAGYGVAAWRRWPKVDRSEEELSP